MEDQISMEAFKNLTFKVNNLKSETDFMKKTFSPAKLKQIESSEEDIKRLLMELDLVKINLENKCDNKALDKIQTQFKKCATTQ